MWKQICRIPMTKNHCRTFLSDAYQCTEAWNSRLQTPVLQQIKLEPFLHEIDRKFQLQGKVCAIDIDILVNKVERSEHLEEIAHLVHRLRMTEETTNALDSTSHAMIRNYLDYGNQFVEDLIRILDDRLSYGIFLDTYTANLLLDRLLRANNYRLAAKVASNLMLQEDFGNEISRNFSLFACYKYAQAPVPFEEPVKVDAEVEPVQETAKSAGKSKKKKVEEIRVRVDFIRNDYFDDHFDIKNSEHLVGKTLIMTGRQTPAAVGNSAQLIGLSLYQKYEDGLKFIETIAKTGEVHKDAIELVKLHLSKVTGLENDEHFPKFLTAIEALAQSTNSKTDNLEEAIISSVKESVSKYEKNEIAEQTKIYSLWCQIREIKLNEELERLRRHGRIQEIDRISNELSEKEERLWFFENEDKVDVKIEQNEEIMRQLPQLKEKKEKTADENYIPPEVGRRV